MSHIGDEIEKHIEANELAKGNQIVAKKFCFIRLIVVILRGKSGGFSLFSRLFNNDESCGSERLRKGKKHQTLV